ncbi:hypothetical protein KCU88_g264, partial [Aureobasidium melanogenum]
MICSTSRRQVVDSPRTHPVRGFTVSNVLNHDKGQLQWWQGCVFGDVLDGGQRQLSPSYRSEIRDVGFLHESELERLVSACIVSNMDGYLPYSVSYQRRGLLHPCV